MADRFFLRALCVLLVACPVFSSSEEEYWRLLDESNGATARRILSMTVEEVERDPRGFDPEFLRSLRRKLIGAAADEPAFTSAAVRIGKLGDIAPDGANVNRTPPGRSPVLFDSGVFRIETDKVVQGGQVAWAKDGRCLEKNTGYRRSRYLRPLAGVFHNGSQVKIPLPAKRFGRWLPERNASGLPNLATPYPILDAVYRLALDVTLLDVTKEGNFEAGADWADVWTRDASFSIHLANAVLLPRVAQKSLLRTVDSSGYAMQDRCTYGGWPALTDMICWVVGAYELANVTGDVEFLGRAYEVSKRSISWAEKGRPGGLPPCFDSDKGLFNGCSSFMESSSAYPSYINSHDRLKRTAALSTNALYYRAYFILAQMARALGLSEEASRFEAKSHELGLAINARFWMSEAGHYGYFVHPDLVLERKSEGLGEALAVLFGIADRERAAAVLANSPRTPFGLPCLWPQYPEHMSYQSPWCMRSYMFAGFYHNGMHWPFTEGYWAWAAARSRQPERFLASLACLVRDGAMEATFMEFHFPEGGARGGSERQLWSAAGLLGAVFHGLFGLNYGWDRLEVRPCVPLSLGGSLRLTGVPFRQAMLDIEVVGSGTRIEAFLLDGKAREEPAVPATLVGTHSLKVVMGQ